MQNIPGFLSCILKCWERFLRIFKRRKKHWLNSENTEEAQKRLFESRDDDGDFSIKLKNGNLVKIHSWVFEMKSEVLGTMMSEKEEKLLEFPKYSDWAVMSLIKFVYGFYDLNLENDVSHEDLLHLIEMGGIYDVRREIITNKNY